ncbi:MAG: hypothetical protein A2Y07_05725 [Planctomycetes bacterium GWF2_50_10]|nr:MAG: hypothetical protein A2Y07_05725 [Planctomycetes bacterium GWF2_50_10]
MLRRDIESAVQNLVNALKDSQVSNALRSAFRSDKKSDGIATLAAYTCFIKHARDFGSAERQIMKILQIEAVLDVGFWAAIITNEDPRHGSDLFHVTLWNLQFTEEHLPQLLGLLSRSSDEAALKEPGKTKTRSHVQKLTVTVIEEQKQSSPQRLIMMFEAIQGLYEAASDILHEPAGDFCVTACDSGSDKTFDFLGLAKVVECVKEIILSFWNKLVFYHENKTEKHLQLIANSLPILEKIEAMNGDGKLEPEKAEILKRQVVSSITKFANAGLTIPEIQKFTIFNPRQLMKPEPKLLVGSCIDDHGPELSKPESVSGALEDTELQKYLEKVAKDFLSNRKAQGSKEGTSSFEEKDQQVA